jgi:cyclophilin family peptidyl-prolyl cis-trans isomerase
VATNLKPQVDDALVGVDFEKNTYQIELDTTLGQITLDLCPDEAPGHCRNLIGLTKIGFYDGVIFHRVIKDFMIQSGCPEGTGRGGPGYTIPAEFNNLPHEPGVMSMARTNDPDSAGSQFFACVARVPHLDNQYTVFGKTADEASLQVVISIGQVATGADDRPETDVKIQSAKIIETAN